MSRLASRTAPSLLALVAALATVRFVIPTRIEAGTSGFWAWLARTGERAPLILVLVTFALYSILVEFWWRRFWGDGDRTTTVPSPRRTIAGIAAVGALLFVARASLVEIDRVAGPSMAPTLNTGDQLVVNKVAYGLRLPFGGHRFRARLPRRGDVIVFANPDGDRAGQPPAVVKRVIGLPGDEISFSAGSPVINGWVVPSCDVGPFLVADGTTVARGRLAVEVLAGRAYLTVRAPMEDGNFTRFKVPSGELFVLGDDRAVSLDSRGWNDGHGGGLPVEEVLGRVSRLAAPAGADGRLRLGQFLAGLRPELRAEPVDVTQLETRIADCLARVPRSTWPPAKDTAPPAG